MLWDCIHVITLLVCEVLGIEPTALYTLAKLSTASYVPRPGSLSSTVTIYLPNFAWLSTSLDSCILSSLSVSPWAPTQEKWTYSCVFSPSSSNSNSTRKWSGWRNVLFFFFSFFTFSRVEPYSSLGSTKFWSHLNFKQKKQTQLENVEWLNQGANWEE